MFGALSGVVAGAEPVRAEVSLVFRPELWIGGWAAAVAVVGHFVALVPLVGPFVIFFLNASLLALVAEMPLEPLFVLLALGEFLGRVLFYKLSPATREFGALHV